MGNVAKSISTNGCEFFYSNPIDNNDNFTDVTLQERISVFKNGISIEKTISNYLWQVGYLKIAGEVKCNGRKIPRRR
jgi:hypothetical protein